MTHAIDGRVVRARRCVMLVSEDGMRLVGRLRACVTFDVGGGLVAIY